jgi:hypothetical protein
MRASRAGFKLVVATSWPEAGGQVVEQFARVLGDQLVHRQEPDIRIDAGGLRVIVAGAEVHVAAEPVVILTHHQDELAVGFEADHTVAHVNTGGLQLLRERDVRRFVETRLELDHDRDLLAVAGGLLQIADDPRVARCPVQGHLDRPHLGIVAGFAQESLHRAGERFVRMHQQQRSGIANAVEDAAPNR